MLIYSCLKVFFGDYRDAEVWEQFGSCYSKQLLALNLEVVVFVAIYIIANCTPMNINFHPFPAMDEVPDLSA